MVSAASATSRQHFSKVHRPLVAELPDLLAATEAVGHDDRRRSSADCDCRQQALSLRNGLGNFEFIRLESEGSGHAAAAGLNRLRPLRPRCRSSAISLPSVRRRPPCDGNVRAPECARPQASGTKSGAFAASQSASSQTCSRKLLRARIVGEQLQQLVLEDAGATRLEKDERQPGVDLRGHAIEDVARDSGALRREGRSRRAAGRSRYGPSRLCTAKPAAVRTVSAATSVCGW